MKQKNRWCDSNPNLNSKWFKFKRAVSKTQCKVIKIVLLALIFSHFPYISEWKSIFVYIHTNALPSFGLLDYLLLSPACPADKKKYTNTFWSKNTTWILLKWVPWPTVLRILTFFCMVWISVSLTVFSFIDSETNVAWNPRNKQQ